MRLTPPVLSLLVPLLESLLDGLLGLLPLGRLLEGLRGNGTLERLELEHVSGGEEVGVVDDLDERLNLGSTSNSLLAHVLGHLEGVPVIPNLVVGMEGGNGLNTPLNASNNGVGVRSLLGPVVLLLDDDDLLAGLTTREDDSDFSGLVD